MFFVAEEKGDLWKECITVSFVAFYSVFIFLLKSEHRSVMEKKIA